MLRSVLIIASTVLLCAGAVSAQPRLLRSTKGSGGVRAAGEALPSQDTVSQAAAGLAAGGLAVGGFAAGGLAAAEASSDGIGFWYRAEQETDAAGGPPPVALSLVLGQNYPNPFGPASPSGASSARMEFRLEAGGHTVLAVHDLMGQRRAVLIDEELDAGRYVAVLHAAALPSGVYFYRLVQGTRHAERRLLLLR